MSSATPVPASPGAGAGASGPAQGAAGARPVLASSSQSWPVRIILAIAAVLCVAAIFAVWANRQLLDEGYWTHTNGKLLQNHAIQGQLSAYLTEQLYTNVDLTGELESGLPSQLKPLAGPAAGGLRPVVEKGIVVALGTTQIQQLWRVANEVTHRQLVELIENKNNVLRTPSGGAVVLDLRPLLVSLANRFGAPKTAIEKLRASVGQVTILRSKTLETAKKVTRGLRALAVVLPALALAMFALAIGLASGRRSRALVDVGLVAAGAGIVSLIVRSIAGRQVVDQLVSNEGVRPAARAAWSIATSLLVEISVAMIFVGVLVVLAGLLAGRSRPAAGTRRTLAPYLRDRPELAFGVAVIALLIVFLWGPIAATQKLTGIVVITLLALFGVEMLRRQTAQEFPDAHYLPERDGLRELTAELRGSLARRGARMRAGVSSIADERRRHNAPTAPGVPLTPVDQLERLAALHSSGALTDEEFAAAKRELLPNRPDGPAPPTPPAAAGGGQESP